MNLVTVKEWFQKGIKKLKWFASLISERLHVELAIIKVLNNMEELKAKRQRIMIKLGERLYQLKDSPEYTILSDSEIKELFKEIAEIEKQMDSLREKADALSKVGD